MQQVLPFAHVRLLVRCSKYSDAVLILCSSERTPGFQSHWVAEADDAPPETDACEINRFPSLCSSQLYSFFNAGTNLDASFVIAADQEAGVKLVDLLHLGYSYADSKSWFHVTTCMSIATQTTLWATVGQSANYRSWLLSRLRGVHFHVVLQ